MKNRFDILLLYKGSLTLGADCSSIISYSCLYFIKGASICTQNWHQDKSLIYLIIYASRRNKFKPIRLFIAFCVKLSFLIFPLIFAQSQQNLHKTVHLGSYNSGKTPGWRGTLFADVQKLLLRWLGLLVENAMDPVLNGIPNSCECNWMLP